MFRILIPVDGSDASLRAVDHLIAHAAMFQPGAVEIDLLNVEPPLPGAVADFVSAEQVKQYHQEQGMKALAAARERLQRTGLKHQHHVAVGEPANVIAQYASERKADQIVMGTRGLGSIGGLLLGSVATKVVHLAEVPVVLVK